MKKLLLAVICFAFFQANSFAQSLEDPKGEIRLNFLNTIVLGSVELGYEKFFKPDQSLGLEVHLNDRFGYRSQGNGSDFSATSFLASYNFYFAGNNDGKVYISPYFKYRIGEFTEVVNNANVVTSLNSAYIGLIAGYRWNFNNFAFGPFGAIGRGLSQSVADRFSVIELKAGFNVGYRF